MDVLKTVSDSLSIINFFSAEPTQNGFRFVVYDAADLGQDESGQTRLRNDPCGRYEIVNVPAGTKEQQRGHVDLVTRQLSQQLGIPVSRMAIVKRTLHDLPFVD